MDSGLVVSGVLLALCPDCGDPIALADESSDTIGVALKEFEEHQKNLVKK